MSAIIDRVPAPFAVYDFECFGPDGKIKWRERTRNLVTNAGKDDLLDKYFKGSSYTAAWYLGLKGTGSVAAGDTLASHAGWSEVTPYTGNRKTLSFGSVSGQTLVTSAASFAITGTATVAGGFIASVNSGTSGLLYSASDFSARARWRTAIL